jgi:hypothetical protein
MTAQRLFAKLLAQATAEHIRDDVFSPLRKHVGSSPEQCAAIDHLMKVRGENESRSAIDWLIREVATSMAFRIAVLVDESYPPYEVRSSHDDVLSLSVCNPDQIKHEQLVHEIYYDELDYALGSE